jgi:diguanylate cyclase (GGDEF)-like protein/PAS domain S-box-containing protein
VDIAEAQDLFSGVVDSAPIGIYIAHKTRFRFVNESFQQLTGYPLDELLDTNPLDLVHPEDRTSVREHAISRLKGKISRLFEYRIVSKGGEHKWIMGSVSPVRYHGERATLGYSMNVTRLIEVQQELRDSELHYRTLVETSPDATFVFGVDRTIRMCSQSAAALYGVERAEQLIGRSVWEFVAPEELDRLLAGDTPKLHSGAFRYTAQKADGTRFPAEANVSMHLGPDGKPAYYLSIVRDDTERDLRERQLAHMAGHDPLTGLSNRRILGDALARSVARAHRSASSALLFMDVDHFKVINDTLGHGAGDRVLVTVTSLLQSKLRGGDLLARIGGDEFAALVEVKNVEGALVAAERLRVALEDFVLTVDGCDFRLGLSIGMVVIDGEHDASSVLSGADSAMYMAKQKGGNQVCFHERDVVGPT